MAEVPDHLAPKDGLSNCRIEFDALFAGTDPFGNGATVRFSLTDAEGESIGYVSFPVPARHDGNVSMVIADGHRMMIDTLRQWLHRLDVARAAYEKQSRP